jgi:hypothetical protein
MLDIDPIILRSRRLPHNDWTDLLRRKRARFVLNRQNPNSIMEGDYFTPQQLAAEINPAKNHLVVFVGQPDVDIAQKAALLRAKNFSGRKYFQRLGEDDLANWMTRFRNISRMHRQECQSLGITFFDFSDLKSLDAGQQDAAAWMKARLHHTES